MIIPLSIAGCFLLLLLVLFWFRWKQKISKGRFALTIVTTLLTCFVFSVSSISSSLPTAIMSTISEALGYGKINAGAPDYIVLPLSLLAMYYIYKFGKSAIKNWEAPSRVSEVNLAEENLDNSIFALTSEQIRLISKKEKDPIASDYFSSWENDFTPQPRSIETRDLLKDMLVSCIRELEFQKNGWRDNGKLWIGEIYGLSLDKPSIAIAFLFEETPNIESIKSRIDTIHTELKELDVKKFFAIYQSEKGETKELEKVKIYDFEVDIYSSRRMLLEALNLTWYAKSLISTFEKTHIGGTSATLSNSFVELYIKGLNESSKVIKLQTAIESWLSETGNKHLAITGEYGQGKSTALLKVCVDWAYNFLKTGEIGERIPLLIELRGQSPSENDPISFISSWCTRYRLDPTQIMNLIKSGGALLIFEGFDELRNAGKAYYRHQHFNALWKFAYPNNKLIFTGRPNFFLDQSELNRTLRNQINRVNVGDLHTEVWNIQKLDIIQIEKACRSYEESIRDGIIASTHNNKDFLDIISRPSMLPVVATIWPNIQELQQKNAYLTRARLLEMYIQAVFSRKDKELTQDRDLRDSPKDSRYLLLPKQLLELLTICVAWRMSGLSYKNTIPRSEISEMVKDIYPSIITIGKSDGVSPEISDTIIRFEKRYETESQSDRIDAITSEICSAGLLVSDAAGGASNLRFPHKQFFEFLVAKSITITTDAGNYRASQLIKKSSRETDLFVRLSEERNSISYLSECIGEDFIQITSRAIKLNLKVSLFNELFFLKQTTIFLNLLKKYQKLTGKKIFSKTAETLENIITPSDSSTAMIQRSLLSINTILFFMSGVSLSSIIINSGLIETSNLNNEFEIPKVILSLLLIALTAIFILSIKAKSNHSEVLLNYLKEHWKRSGDISLSRSEEVSLALASISKGKVQYPKSVSIPKIDYNDYLYPSEDFGKSKE
ncbi:NACHT domain-containing protein [Marinomonas gallaica]|uniref:NACHT domain-containing protein n=1 Tax=Marinomonas gallaica TaxID=1806667 RepID=UPI003CE51965